MGGEQLAELLDIIKRQSAARRGKKSTKWNWLR